MFIFNIKINKKLIFNIFFCILVFIILIIAGISTYRIINYNTTDVAPPPKVANISSSNYTNILKSVHDDINQYIGQKITFTGYVYRVYDFSETQFVLARDMIVSSDNQTLVVGFLCDYKDAMSFKDGSWVNISGRIVKGDYHGEIPIIEIDSIKACQKPNDEFVYPPDDTFIPTNALF